MKIKKFKNVALSLILVLSMIITSGISYAQSPIESIETENNADVSEENGNIIEEIDDETEIIVGDNLEENLNETTNVIENKNSSLIPDEALKAVIMSLLELNGEEELTEENLLELTELNASEAGIVDLTGLEGAINLKHIDLSNNFIATFDFNCFVNLETLILDGNILSEVNLENLPLLTLFSANDNKISHISLKNLPSLAEVRIERNHIQSVSNIKYEGINIFAGIYAKNQTIVESATTGEEASLTVVSDDKNPDGDPIDFKDKSAINNTDTSRISLFSMSNIREFSLDITAFINLDGWVEVPPSEYDSFTITNSFVRSRIEYIVTSGIYKDNGSQRLNANHTIYNKTDNIMYTYTFKNGDGGTSYLYYGTNQAASYNSGSGSDLYIYTTSDDDGREYIKKVYYYPILNTVTEIVTTVTDNGEIYHTVNVMNISSENTLVKLDVLAMTDTELNGYDEIPLYSDGVGGVYMFNDTLKLYCEPREGVTRSYAGKWARTNVNAYVDDDTLPSSGAYLAYTTYRKKLDQVIAFDVDSAVYYGAPIVDLGPGESINFAFQERIYSPDELPPVPANAVEVHFVDYLGAHITDSLVLSGIVGKEGNFEVGKIITLDDGTEYEFVRIVETSGIDVIESETKLSADVTFTNSKQDVVLEYQRKIYTGTVVVSYEDVDGDHLSQSITLEGNEGTAYTADSKTFTGYTLYDVEGDETGTFGRGVSTVKFIYEKDTDIAPGTVIVSYVTEEGYELADPEELVGDVGADYITQRLYFEGYELLRIRGDRIGKFTAAEKTVTYIYGAVAEGKVIISFELRDGTKISKDVEMVDMLGRAYSTVKMDIRNYKFLEVIGSETGVYEIEPISVRYIYQKVETDDEGSPEYVPEEKDKEEDKDKDREKDKDKEEEVKEENKEDDKDTDDNEGSNGDENDSSSDITITPSTPGNTIVLNDDGVTYMELDGAGIPLGTWIRDAETGEWIFIPFDAPLGEAPATGDSLQSSLIYIFLVLASSSMLLLMNKKRED